MIQLLEGYNEDHNMGDGVWRACQAAVVSAIVKIFIKNEKRKCSHG